MSPAERLAQHVARLDASRLARTGAVLAEAVRRIAAFLAVEAANKPDAATAPARPGHCTA
jgi:hypothetical protein